MQVETILHAVRPLQQSTQTQEKLRPHRTAPAFPLFATILFGDSVAFAATRASDTFHSRTYFERYDSFNSVR